MDIQNLINEMTVEEKVGQMCVPILQKDKIEADIEKCIKEYRVGMLRYCPNAEYDGNSELVGEPNRCFSPKETADFLNSAQIMAKVPMFIAVDQEGSIRNDINRAGAFAYGGHMAFGAADDTELTYKVAKATGKEFAAMGINLVQAPIVDVLTYLGRKTIKSASFGQNVDKVCTHALAMMKGFKDAGVATMAKHFPGYGSVATDAHKGLAEITKSFEDLDNVDIKPLKVLFKNGLNGVMTGHAITHCIDGEYPATMSEKMIKGYLREKLGFDGIVETDALRMPAIQNKFGTAEASIKAVKAGCDMLLLRGNLQHFEEGYFAVLNAVKSGRISMDTINEAVRRILKQKDEIGLFDKPMVNSEYAEKIVGCAEHKHLARGLAEKSVSVIKNKDLPLNNESRILVICVEPQKLLAAQDDIQCVDMLFKAVKNEFENADGIVVKLQPTEEEIHKIIEYINNYNAVIIGSCNAILYESQSRMIKEVLTRTDKKIVIIAMDSPYDIEVFSNAENYICTYGVSAASAEVVAGTLAGKLKRSAVPPVII